MKLRNKDMKKYLLSVAVSTFVAHVVPAVFFHGEVNAGIAQTICVCLLNVTTALLAWKFAKSDNKMSLLIWHLGLTSLASLLLLFISLSDGAEVMFVYYFITISSQLAFRLPFIPLFKINLQTKSQKEGG